MTSHGDQALRPGEWCWSESYRQPAQVLELQDLWGRRVCRVWLPDASTVARLPAEDLSALAPGARGPSEIAWICAAAQVVEALSREDLLAPIETNVIPLPHQLHALARAMAGESVRYLLADEVGLGKTVEAGLVLRELKLRGLVRRTLVVAPKGLVTQWVQELQLHFQEPFHLLQGDDLATLRRHDGTNPWSVYDQVVCSLDSVKPIGGRRGWSRDRVDTYNRERFEDLLLAGWDLVIVDEAHRLAGSTQEVARHQLGLGLAGASPYLLLLSATPHQGSSEGFHRLLTLLEAEAFPDPASVTRERVAPYCIRTEKRQAIDSGGRPLFTPRETTLVPVAWGPGHGLQEHLYEEVTAYVRWGYDLARRDRRNALGFLMILMQRLVTSSTRAIRTTLERRLAILREPPEPVSDPDSGYGTGQSLWNLGMAQDDEAPELDSQEALDRVEDLHLAVALSSEVEQVERLVSLARRAEAAGPDAKAEALLDQIRKLCLEEGDLDMKVLLFTEFVETQSMLAEYLQARGLSTTCLNGRMSLEERRQVQQDFAGACQVLVSTDAGGEGLNLQFAHVVANYDLPWNPMRLEQRIGRVDRIGQKHRVRALNLILEDTVEFRVREVLEQKLRTILEEFGVDKTTDVLESLSEGAPFEELGTRLVEDPEAAIRRAEELADTFRLRLREARDARSDLPVTESLDPASARRLEGHPLARRLEQMSVHFAEAHGGRFERTGNLVRIEMADGVRLEGTFWRARAEADGTRLLSLETPEVRKILDALPHRPPGCRVPVLSPDSIPEGVHGSWSLWRVGLHAQGPRSQGYFAVFLHEDGRALRPTAQHLWDLLADRAFDVLGHLPPVEGARLEEAAREAALLAGEDRFAQMAASWEEGQVREHEKRRTAWLARQRAVERIGLETVRRFRQERLEEEQVDLERAYRNRTVPLPVLDLLMLVEVRP